MIYALYFILFLGGCIVCFEFLKTRFLYFTTNFFSITAVKGLFFTFQQEYKLWTWFLSQSEKIQKVTTNIYLFDLIGYDGGQFDSQLFRLLEGCREAAQISQSLHADQARSLFVCRLESTVNDV